jgi:hypothetical protein
MFEARNTRSKPIILAALLFLVTTTFGQDSTARRAVGEIDDPGSGLRWYMLHNPAHPGGPGRLTAFSDDKGSSAHPLIEPPRRPIVFAGDRLVVEDHSAVLNAQLEAVALRPAFAGEVIEARLSGKSVRVEILGTRQARLLGLPEAKR